MRGWSMAALAAAVLFGSTIAAYSKHHPVLVQQQPQWGWGFTPAPVVAVRPVHVKGVRHYAKPAKRAVVLHARAEPVEIVSAGPIAEVAGRYLGGNPTGWGHVWCGRFMGMVVKAAGFDPPRGYQLAASWRSFGLPASGPAPGEIAVLRHGHHVGVVLAIVDGGRGVLIRSGNHGHRVADGVYPTAGAVFRRL